MTTANALFKVHIENMPEALNTKKDIDEYIKEFWKDFKEKAKEAKAAKAEKPKRKKGVDKDGNVKEKRPPSPYNIFVKEQYEMIKNANPELDKNQIFSEIARLWNEKKKNDQNEKPSGDVEEKPEDEPKDNAEKENEIEEEKPVEAPKKKQGRKAIKKKPKDEEEKSNEDE